MGSSGNMIKAFEGDPNSEDFNSIRVVKNPGIESANSANLASYNASLEGNQNDIAAYTAKILGLQKSKDAETGMQTTALDRLYNGSLGRQLAAQNATLMSARRNLADRAVSQASARNKLSNLKMGGGDSGYLRSLYSKDAGDILSKADLEDALNQQESTKYLTGLQLGNIGRAQALQEANAASTLLPMQARNAELARRTAAVGGIGSVDLANTNYGLVKKRSGLERWGDFTNALGQTIMDAASVYGSVMGAGGGGGGAGKTGVGAPDYSSGMAAYNQGNAGSGGWGGYN